ncbi:MAG: nucleotidyltransferase family protein [Mesorhizobium sp.]
MTPAPDTAMVLAAGLGKRMRPITDTIPKPLVEIAGKPLIDWGLDALAQAGVTKAVVNVHYLPDLLIKHLGDRQSPAIVISDERHALLDSGGGIVRALPQLGGDPFFILNADTFWIDRADNNLRRLALAWRDDQMDILLMVAKLEQATGHSGGIDFIMSGDGRLTRARGASDGVIYAGAAIIHPRVFSDAPSGPHSLNLQFDQAHAAGRLHGLVLDGDWITVGTPDAIAPAEAAVARARTS